MLRRGILSTAACPENLRSCARRYARGMSHFAINLIGGALALIGVAMGLIVIVKSRAIASIFGAPAPGSNGRGRSPFTAASVAMGGSAVLVGGLGMLIFALFGGFGAR